MSKQRPAKVSLGLPVYNGERFVGKAIQSVLSQTYKDFELIISDNASTDRTAEICEEFARRDSRIKYIRQEINVGAKANFNRVFEYAGGEYFKWVAADDVCGPRYLELTVAALDGDPQVVLAHTRSSVINGQGEVVSAKELQQGFIVDDGIPVLVSPCDRTRDLGNESAVKRFQEVLLGTFWCFEIFALVRRSAMLQAYPKGPYYGSDKVVLAQLAMLGKFAEAPEVQFYRRAHHGNSTNMTVKARESWSHAPKKRWKLPTQFPCLAGYLKTSYSFSPTASQRLRSLIVVGQFMLRGKRYRVLAVEMLSLARPQRRTLRALPQQQENVNRPEIARAA